MATGHTFGESQPSVSTPEASPYGRREGSGEDDVTPASQLLATPGQHLKSPTTNFSQINPSLASSGSPKAGFEVKPSDQPRRLHSARTLLGEWKWEFAAWAIGTAAFGTIAGLLIHFDDKSLSKWHSEVQLSTIVAVLAQVVQSALLMPISYCISQLKWAWLRQDRPAIDVNKFDLASRGPNGSLWLLLGLGWKPHLVSLGAISTILMLGFPAFVQQATQTRFKEAILRTPDAAVLRAQSYYGNTSVIGSGDIRSNNASLISSEDVDPYLQAAITSGMTDAYSSLSNISASCPTEKCTWEPYTTVAMCSSVEEISGLRSEDIEKTAVLGRLFFDNTAETFWARAVMDSRKYLPSDDHYKVLRDSGIVPVNSTGVEDDDLFDFVAIYLFYYDPCLGGINWGPDDEPYPWQNPKNWRGYKAKLELCVQKLQTTFNSTSTETKVINSYTGLSWKDFYPRADPDAHGGCVRLEGTEYCTSWNAPDTLWNSVADMFNISAGLAGIFFNSTNAYFTEWSPQLVQDVLGTGPSYCWDDPSLRLEGFSRRISNLATSVTNAFRTSPNGSERFIGTAYRGDQVIQTDFWWLLFPLALYVVITCFFAITVFRTRNLPLWKASPLILLKCMDETNTIITEKKADKEAKNEILRLKKVDSAWYLEDADKKDN